MPGATRQGTDSAGGTLIQGSSDVTVNGQPSVRLGDAVQGHGKSPHSSPTMAEGSSSVLVNGIPMCHQGHTATCGHPATGSSDVIVGDGGMPSGAVTWPGK